MAISEIDYRTPFYLQLREVVRDKIDNGEYLPGHAIPSEGKLAEQYGINRLTVRNAIDALVHEGLLRRVQGRGVFVVGQRLERDLDNLAGFHQTMIESCHAHEPKSKVIERSKRIAGRKYADIFSVDPEAELFYIKRVNSSDGVPISIEETYIPCAVMPRLEGIDLSVFTLYEAYGFYGICLDRAMETLDLVTLEARDARMLKVSPSETALLFTSISYNIQGRAIECTYSYTRGDICCYTIRNKRS